MCSEGKIFDAYSTIRHDEVITPDDLIHYQAQRLGPTFRNVPCIQVSSLNLSFLEPLLSRVIHSDHAAFSDLVFVPSGDMFLMTTHLETLDAGDRMMSALQREAQWPFEREFVAALGSVVALQHTFHRRWVALGTPLFPLILCEINNANTPPDSIINS